MMKEILKTCVWCFFAPLIFIVINCSGSKISSENTTNINSTVNTSTTQHCKSKSTSLKDEICCDEELNYQSKIPNVLPSENLRKLISSIPVHAPITDSVSNLQCREDSQMFVQAVKDFQLWALKMHDASAKIPSGLLNGNVNQFGDFDQCLSVDDPITARYCLAYLDLQIKSDIAASPTLKRINSLLHSHNVIVSQFDDPGHRIPRFSTINWGLCIPSSCRAEDLELYLRDKMELLNNSTELNIKVRVEDRMCYTKNSSKISTMSILVMFLFLSIIFAATIGTYYEADTVKGNVGKRIVKCFSLKRNLNSLLKTSTQDDEVRTVHGLRAINAIALILFHKSVALQFNPFVNRTSMQEILSMPWSVIGRTSIIYTDSFIMFSGLLTSYSFIKELNEKRKINIWDKYISRYIRITPNLIAVILFCTFISEHLGSGPQWNLVVKHHADICQKTMWRNFLYIHNYFGFENMCLTHTHQLGIDMQLFVVSPILAYALWKNAFLGMTLLVGIAAWSTALRYNIVYEKNLSTMVYSGISVSKLFETANWSYILPTHRATIYVIGVAMGYCLRKMPKIKMSLFQVVVGWVLAVVVGLTAMCAPFHMVDREYQYNPKDSALFNAWSPIIWSMFLIWAIFCSEQGYGGFIRDILRWKGFVVFTRIAYAVYLTQFPVFFYNVGLTRNPQYYTPNLMFEMGEVTCILIVSVAMTLLIDLPAQEMKKEFWSKRSCKTVPEIRPIDEPEKETMGQKISSKRIK